MQRTYCCAQCTVGNLHCSSKLSDDMEHPAEVRDSPSLDIATNPRSDQLKFRMDSAHQASAESDLGCMSYQLQMQQLMRHELTRAFDL